jgi:hypothetical protein
LFLEKAHSIIKTNGTVGMIVPISITSSDSVSALHNILYESCSYIQVSSFADRPQQIFKDAATGCSIIKFKKDNKPIEKLLSTKLQRIKDREKLNKILNKLVFVNVNDIKLYGRIPKISYDIEVSIFNKILNCVSNIGGLKQEKGKPIYYRNSGGRYFKVITNYPTNSKTEKIIYFDKKIANSIGAMLSSNLFFWFYQVISDNHSITQTELDAFGIPTNKLADAVISKLKDIYSEYLKDIEENANVRTNSGSGSYKVETFKEYKIVYSKHLIDRIDDIIGPLYKLTKEEIYFIKNYEKEFRMRGEKNIYK